MKVTASDEGGSVSKGGVPGGNDRCPGEKAVPGSHGQQSPAEAGASWGWAEMGTCHLIEQIFL